MERMVAAEVAATEAETQARIGEVAALADRATGLEALYHGTLLPQTRIAAASALAGYRVGGVDFETAMSAQLEVVRTELAILRLTADRALAGAELEYLSAHSLGDARTGGLR